MESLSQDVENEEKLLADDIKESIKNVCYLPLYLFINSLKPQYHTRLYVMLILSFFSSWLKLKDKCSIEIIENFAARKLNIKRKREEINDIMEGQSKKAQNVYDCLDKAITNLGVYPTSFRFFIFVFDFIGYLL